MLPLSGLFKFSRCVFKPLLTKSDTSVQKSSAYMIRVSVYLYMIAIKQFHHSRFMPSQYVTYF